MMVLDSLVTDLFNQIAREASKLARYSQRKTLSSEDIQTAVKLLMPRDLAAHAMTEMSKAIAKFEDNK